MSCVKNLRVKNLKACDATINNLQIKKNLNSSNLTAENISSYNAEITNAQIENLDLVTLNGKHLNCGDTFTNTNDQIIRVQYDGNDPIKPENPNDQFNDEIYDTLWVLAVEHGVELAERLQCGRLQKKIIYNQYGCIQCPPDELVDCVPTCPGGGTDCACPTSSGMCPSVPLKIWGIQTIAPFIQQQCGTLETDVQNQLVSTVTYNLDVLNLTATLSDRVVSILLQGAFIDKNGDIIYQIFDQGNRQFGAVLDPTYGEKFTGTIIVPSSFTQDATFAMPNYGDLAAIQLVIYTENGVEIDVFNPSFSQKNIKTKNIKTKNIRVIGRRNVLTNETPPGPVDVQNIQTPPSQQVVNIQFANVSNLYDIIDTASLRHISMEYDITIEQEGVSFQYAQLFQLINSNHGGYLAINRTDTLKYQVLVSMWNAVSAAAAQSYVSVAKFEGEGEGYSLRITQENIDQFPIEVGKQYSFRIFRKSVETDGVNWEFVVKNVTDSTEVTLGVIKSQPAFDAIARTGISQFVECFGLSPPTTCATIDKTISLFSFPRLRNEANEDVPVKYVEWTAPPNQCGTWRKELVSDTGPVRIFFRDQ
jgi:hypothetical protein